MEIEIAEMKIKLDKYNPAWNEQFNQIKNELNTIVGFVNPQIEHIGSTAVCCLSAKPIIDILVGLQDESDLDKITMPLMEKGYIYYEKYNKEMPYRRFFVKHDVDHETLSIPTLIGENDPLPDASLEHHHRMAHIHAIPVESEHWVRHIAFRDYLRKFSSVKDEYQRLKEELSSRKWQDGNEYNEAKDEFIKHYEQKAMKWHESVEVISIREQPQYKDAAILYFQQSWKEVAPIMYQDSITHCIGAANPLPQWYILKKGDSIIGCAGLITNDFISRGELYPWLCALHIDEKHRGNGYPKLLLQRAKEDTSKMGFKNFYLSTDLEDYYEKHGFTYIGQGYHPWDEESRVYAIEL